MADEIIILITTGTEKEAQTLAKALVEQGLAACVNIVPKIKSIFKWNESLNEETESLLIIKSIRPKLDRLILKVKELHTYDIPEIIALPIIGGSSDYLQWLHAETAQE